MGVTLSADRLAQALADELTLYTEEVEEKLRQATRDTMAELVKTTRANAPKDTGTFAKHIAGDFRGLKRGHRNISATWYVKAPHYRLTHLLVHGHATVDGGRVDGDPFLKNALDKVLPEYEKKVEEAVKNDS